METNETWETIKKLLRGSEELDRMKKEIDRFVKMIKGLLDPYWSNWDVSHKVHSFSTPDPRCFWEIDTKCKKMLIRYVYYAFPNTKKNGRVFYSSDGIEPPYEWVEKVHEALPVLFQELSRLVYMTDKLKPFLWAAKAAEEK